MSESTADGGVRGRLEAAAAGLLYVSETESPFEYVEFPGAAPGKPTCARVRAALGEARDTPVRELSLDRFLAGHIEAADPADPVAQENVARFQALKQALADHLPGVRVFRVGDAQVRYYALGRAPDGTLAGLAVSALET